MPLIEKPVRIGLLLSLILVISTFPAQAAFAQENPAQESPESVVRSMSGLLSWDPTRLMDRERFAEFFADDAVVAFGTSLDEVAVMPLELYLDDWEERLQAGEFGGVGHTIELVAAECTPVNEVAMCFARYRFSSPEEDEEPLDLLGTKGLLLKLQGGRWLINSISWVVEMPGEVSIEALLNVGLLWLPTAGEGVRSTPDRSWSRALPLLGQRVVEKGFELPMPLGVGVVAAWKKQQIDLSNLEVAFNDGERNSAAFLNFREPLASTLSVQAMFDLWLFPFLNVYGLIGGTRGESKIPFSFLGSELLELAGLGDLCEGLRPSEACFKTYSTTVRPSIQGRNAAIGLNPALGWRDFFFTMPTTYTWTHLKNGSWVTSVFVSPRIGLSVPTATAGALSVYVGAAYLDASENLNNQFIIDAPDMPEGAPDQFKIEYWIRSQNSDPWNYLVGFNWSLSKRWSLHAEADAGGTRQGATGSLTWRF